MNGRNVKEHKIKKNILVRPFHSIRTAMLVNFSLLIMLTLLLFSIISMNYTQKAVMGNSIDYMTRLINQVNSSIDSYINYMENITELVRGGGEVQRYFFGGYAGDNHPIYQQIVTQFNTVVETRKDIVNIAVVSSDRKSIINNGNDVLNPHVRLEDVEWFRKALESEDTVLTASHIQNLIYNNYKWVVTLAKSITDPETSQKEGVLFIDLNYRVLRDLCENNNLGPDYYIFIMDENGKIIYHPKQQLLYNGLMTEKTREVLDCQSNYFLTGEGEESKLYTISTSDRTGWSVVGVADTAVLIEGREETKRLYFLLSGILLIAAVGLSMALSGAITRPIKILRESMQEAEKGNFESANIQVAGNTEIDSLSDSFNTMLYRIKQLMEQNIYEQEQKRLSELKALQSQINPHFLYNTLDSIIWMAEGNKNKEVVLMTSALAKLLRQSISNEAEIVPIEKEVDYTRSYLTIEKMRYKDKLEYEINVREEIYREEIIKLVLQPIVENAISHGIKYKESKGLIKIEGYAGDGCIYLQVYDNGVGMDPQTLEHIFDKDRRDEKKSSSVGIHNVQSRLQLYYGPEYGLSYQSIAGEGTVATIKIPGEAKRREEE